MVHATSSPPMGGSSTLMTRSSKAEVEAIVRQLRSGSDPKAQLQAAQTLGTLWLFMERGGGGDGGQPSPSSGAKGPSSFEAVLAAAADLGAWDALVDTLNQVFRSLSWVQQLMAPTTTPDFAFSSLLLHHRHSSPPMSSWRPAWCLSRSSWHPPPPRPPPPRSPRQRV